VCVSVCVSVLSGITPVSDDYTAVIRACALGGKFKKAIGYVSSSLQREVPKSPHPVLPL
jgi:pentatricopeptide repeat protein